MSGTRWKAKFFWTDRPRLQCGVLLMPASWERWGCLLVSAYGFLNTTNTTGKWAEWIRPDPPHRNLLMQLSVFPINADLQKLSRKIHGYILSPALTKISNPNDNHLLGILLHSCSLTSFYFRNEMAENDSVIPANKNMGLIDNILLQYLCINLPKCYKKWRYDTDKKLAL